MTVHTEPRPVPDAVAEWTRCGGCGSLVYRKKLLRNLEVCPACGRHHRLPADRRLRQLLDPDSERPLPGDAQDADPLGFSDTRPYPQRLAEARARTGLAEAAIAATGTVIGRPVVAVAMDFRFLGGSLGAGVGRVIERAADHALATRTPLLIVTASGGARMQEGAVALMQMARTANALTRLDEAGVLTVALITDPTYGGVAASYATLCDVIVAEPGARMGFAGPRVIQQTIRERLPAGFQTAEKLLEHGVVDMVRPRTQLRATLARLLDAAGAGRVATPAANPDDGRAVATSADALPRRDPWQTVQGARDLNRPTTLEYLAGMFSDFEELHGDRLGADCPAIVGGIGLLDGVPTVAIGHQKGRDPKELARRNFAMASPAGYRKAARLMRLAEKLRAPVLTLIDTPGAHPGVAAEEQGQAVAIAECLRLMGRLTVPVVAVVTGEGGSGGALALAVADRVLICEGAVYSVISPEGCAAILWDDASLAPRAAEALRLTAPELLRLGIVDGVVREPERGAAAEPAQFVDRLRQVVAHELRALLQRDGHDLVASRRQRFRGFDGYRRTQ